MSLHYLESKQTCLFLGHLLLTGQQQQTLHMLSGIPNANNAALNQAVLKRRGQDRRHEYDPLWVQRSGASGQVIPNF